MRASSSAAVDTVGIGDERDLGIDDEVAATGKQDDDIGTDGAVALAVFAFNAGEGLLEDVLLAFAQARLVEQIAENEFAPVALRLGRATQRSGEVARFFGELLVETAESANEGLELGHA